MQLAAKPCFKSQIIQALARRSDLLLHEAPEAGEVCGDGGDAHDGALGRRVAPRLVVRREHAHVTPCNKQMSGILHNNGLIHPEDRDV